MNISEFRKRYPEYDKYTDDSLADAVYEKHYSKYDRMSFEEQFRPDYHATLQEFKASEPMRGTLAETDVLSPATAPAIPDEPFKEVRQAGAMLGQAATKVAKDIDTGVRADTSAPDFTPTETLSPIPSPMQATQEAPGSTFSDKAGDASSSIFDAMGEAGKLSYDGAVEEARIEAMRPTPEQVAPWDRVSDIVKPDISKLSPREKEARVKEAVSLTGEVLPGFKPSSTPAEHAIDIVKEAAGFIVGMGAGVTKGVTATGENLYMATKYINDKLGFDDKEGVGKAIEQFFLEAASQGKERGLAFDAALEDLGVSKLNQFTSETVGSLIPAVTEFGKWWYGIPLAIVQGAAQAKERGYDEAMGALLGGAKRFLMEKILHATGMLKRSIGIPVFASFFGADEAINGEDGTFLERFTHGAGTGVILSVLGGSGKAGVGDMVNEARRVIRDVGDTRDPDARLQLRRRTFRWLDKVPERVAESTSSIMGVEYEGNKDNLTFRENFANAVERLSRDFLKNDEYGVRPEALIAEKALRTFVEGAKETEAKPVPVEPVAPEQVVETRPPSVEEVTEPVTPEVVKPTEPPAPLPAEPVKAGEAKSGGSSKELWQMTEVEATSEKIKDVFPIKGKAEIVNDKPIYKYSTTVKWGGEEKSFEITTKFPLNGMEQAGRLHKEIIKGALSEGKSVPLAALKDYPDLKAEYEKRVDNYEMVRHESSGAVSYIPVEKPPAPEPAKEPWQMTREEYAKHKGRAFVKIEHQEFVRQALSEGKPIPLEVLKDYPDLKAEPVVETPKPAVTPSRTLKTLSGREVTPPSIRLDTNRKATADSLKADIWLRQEAINEAKARGDEFNLLQFEGSNPKRLSQADKEGMHDYLFGDVKDIFELIEAETPKAEPTPTEEPITVEGKGKEKTVKVDIPKAEAEALSPKQQKEYLIDEVDKAIEEAPEGMAFWGGNKPGWREEYEARKSEVGTVTIEVPGDGKFTILNNKGTLEAFKKRVKSQFPGTAISSKPKKPSMPSTKPTGARITFEEGEGEYYNEFRPRKQAVYSDATKDDGTPRAMYTADGFFTDGYYGVRTLNPGKIGKTAIESIDVKLLDRISEDGPPATIVGEAFTDRTLQAHVVDANGVEAHFNPKNIDVILTLYPKAKPFLTNDGQTLVFKDGKKVVGVTTALKQEPPLSQVFPERFTEVTKDTRERPEPAPAAEKPKPKRRGKTKTTYTDPKRDTKQYTRERVFEDVYGQREPMAETEESPVQRRRAERARIIEEQPPTTAEETRYGWDAERERFDMPERVPVVELPEIIEIVKMINRKSIPTVFTKLRGSTVKGFFDPRSGKIKISPDVQRDPAELAEVLGHEIGHLWGWLPEREKTILRERGNILGHIGALKEYTEAYLKEHPRSGAEAITQDDINLLRAEAERQARSETVPETGQPATPTHDEILAIWRSVDVQDKALEIYIKVLTDVEKVELVKAAMKKADLPSWFSYRRGASEGSVDPARIEEILQTLIRNEILERRLHELETVDTELRDLTKFWRPFDEGEDAEYTAYRYSPPELYADMISVLFNDPLLLKEAAPSAYRAFFAHMDARPEVKAAYDAVMQKIVDPAKLMEGTERNIHQMFYNGNIADKARIEAHIKRHPLREFTRFLKVTLSDSNQKWRELVRRKNAEGKRVNPEDNPYYLIEESMYKDSIVFAYLNEINADPFFKYRRSGVKPEDFDTYLLMKRISEYEGDKLNPGGITKKRADEVLNELSNRYGDGILERLDEVSQAFFEVRKKHIIPIVEASGIASEKVLEIMKSRPYYVKFDVLKDLGANSENVGAFYNPGADNLGRTYARVGTAKDVAAPFVSTIRQDIALIRAAHRKIVLTKMMDFLNVYSPDMLKPALFSSERRAYMPAPKGMATIKFLESGKTKAIHMDSELAQLFTRDPYHAEISMKAMNFFGGLFQRVSNIPKRLMVTNNPIFVLWNTLYRDPKAFYRHIPEATVKDVTWHMLKNAKPVWDHVFGGKHLPIIDEMHRGAMLNIKRSYGVDTLDIEFEMDRMFTEWGLSPSEYSKNVGSLWSKVLDGLERPLQFGEEWVKVAGYSFLKESPVKRSPREIAHLVRDRIGTPNNRRAGLAFRFYNNMFMFSNIAKEGIRASVEAMRIGPKQIEYDPQRMLLDPTKAYYNPVKFWYKTAIMDVMPKVLMYAAAQGWLEPVAPGSEDAMDGISEYSKMNYINIPLGVTKNGDSVYYIHPQDYSGQVIGGVTWSILNMNKLDDALQFNKYMLNQVPYAGLNPIIQLFIDWMRYSMGNNPYDSYTGGYVIPESTFKAGRWSYESWKAMMKSTFNTIGASAVWERLENKPDVQIKTWFEKLLGVPVAGTILRRFVRVENLGHLQEMQKLIRPIQESRYQELKDMDNAIYESLAASDPDHKGSFNLSSAHILSEWGKLFNEGKLKRHDPKEFAKRYRETAYMLLDDRWYKTWRNAQTNEEKFAILEAYMEWKKKQDAKKK